MSAGTVYLLHFDQPYKHARHYVGWTAERQAPPGRARGRARRAAAGRGPRGGDRLAAGPDVARRPGPGAADQAAGRARPQCPLCGVKPRQLPRNADGSLSRSRTTDAQKAAAGVMTAAQLAEHTALRRGR